jgi:hypothetical protein
LACGRPSAVEYLMDGVRSICPVSTAAASVTKSANIATSGPNGVERAPPDRRARNGRTRATDVPADEACG